MAEIEEGHMARPNGVREAWQQGRAVMQLVGNPSSFSAEVMASMAGTCWSSTCSTG